MRRKTLTQSIIQLFIERRTTSEYHTKRDKTLVDM